MARSHAGAAAARYRRISSEMYADDKFLALSAPRPCAQFLWIYLITGPFSTLIPCIRIGGPAAISERLGWKLRAFRRCFVEIEQQAMARADWKRHVIFLPNALKHNMPPNPSVVRSWRQAWAEIPACDLKALAARHIREVLAGVSAAMAEAFDDVTGEHVSAHVSPHVPPHGVSQQEQEQEQDVLAHESTPVTTRDPFRAGRHPLEERVILEPWSLEAFDRFWAVYPRPEARKRALDAWRALNPSPELAAHIAADVQKRVAAGWATEPRYVPFPAKYLEEQRWQEPPLSTRGGGDRTVEGLPCMRPCPACGEVQEGRYQSGRKVFPACVTCAEQTQVSA